MGDTMPFFADIDPDQAEKPHEAFDRWREARRARRHALAHDNAATLETTPNPGPPTPTDD